MLQPVHRVERAPGVVVVYGRLVRDPALGLRQQGHRFAAHREPAHRGLSLCDFQPRWTAYETAAALAATAAEGFSLRLRDCPPAANWIQTPGCYVDMADMLFTVAPELFECFVPGQVGPNPLESCVGSFYDLCSGSE